MRGHPDLEFLVRRRQQLGGYPVDRRPRLTRVLFAQSSRMHVEALMFALESDPSLEPIGYALDGWEALELIESLCPDVVVVGPTLRSLDSLTLTRLLDECWPHVRVIVLTEGEALDRSDRAFAAGAVGCLAVERSTEELLDAIVMASASIRPLRVAECADAEASLA